MQGKFFSSDSEPEVILQKSFAEELLGKTPPLGQPEPGVAELAKPLLGKELTDALCAARGGSERSRSVELR